MGKLEVKAEAAADAGRESNNNQQERQKDQVCKEEKLKMQTLARPSQMSLKWSEMILITLIELSRSHMSSQNGLKYI